MKRLLLFLVAVMVLVGIACASYNFQSEGNGTTFKTNADAYPITYTQNVSGGNSYISTSTFGELINFNANPTSYYALTDYGGGSGSPGVELKDNAGTMIYTSPAFAMSNPGDRLEINVVGGTANFYRNGIFILNSTPLSQNPSYVGYGAIWSAGTRKVDDIVYGATDDKTVLGMPKSNAYYIKKDIVTPSASGFYNTSTNALVYSNVMPMTFSRSNLTGECLANESIYLIHYNTGTVYNTQYTGNSCTGIRNFDISAGLFTSSAPYGFYQARLGTTVSDTISYIANGANINFDRDEYSAGDVATITYLIDAAYYDTSTYTYSIKIVDVYGTVIDSQNIATASGNVTYTWVTGNTQGVYYAEIIGTPNAGGNTVLYNYDYATLSAYFDVTGYVHDAETELPISGALVNASQGDIVSNTVSGYDGNYTVSGFISGVLFGMNTSATSHQPYWNNFTPITSHTLHINVTLIPSSPTKTDITLGGVCRDTTYGRPIPACSVDIWNATSGQYFTKVANSVGFYNKTLLTENNRYSIEGMKLRYHNSTIYSKTAVRA